MIEVGKYYKGINYKNLIVQCTGNGIDSGTFTGRVVNSGNSPFLENGLSSLWVNEYFEPFEPIETTQPEQSPTKDVELRLECLKLAVSNEKSQTIKMLLEDGEKIYDWITKNHNQ